MSLLSQHPDHTLRVSAPRAHRSRTGHLETRGGHSREARQADLGGGSLSIWGGAGWSHCLQMPPPPSAWPDPAPTWPMATQRPPANTHLFLQGTRMPQVTHAPRGQWKRGSRVPQVPRAGLGGQASPDHPGQHQAGWSGAHTAHIVSSWPETQHSAHRLAVAMQRRLSAAGRQPIEDSGPPQLAASAVRPPRGAPTVAAGTRLTGRPGCLLLPGSLLMLGASVGGRCPSSPSLTRGPELPPWRWASVSARSASSLGPRRHTLAEGAEMAPPCPADSLRAAQGPIGGHLAPLRTQAPPQPRPSRVWTSLNTAALLSAGT